MKWRAAAGATLVAFLAGVSVAYADPPTPGQSGSVHGNRPDTVETNVVATGAGVTIYVGIRSTAPGSPGDPGSADLISGPDTPSCSAVATNISHQSAWVRRGLQEHPDTIPFAVNCDDGYFGIAWVPLDAPGAPDLVVEVLPNAPVDPFAVAQSLLGLVPLPPISVGTNPGTGLVAMSSWFWVDGYDGSTLSGAETLGPVTVEVEITPERYDWSFGDGEALTTVSLGQPYPDESDIQHTYEQSSLVAGGPYEVRLDIVFEARYREITEEDDGEGGTVVLVGEWRPLDPIVRPFTLAYPVQQLQSVLTAGR